MKNILIILALSLLLIGCEPYKNYWETEKGLISWVNYECDFGYLQSNDRETVLLPDGKTVKCNPIKITLTNDEFKKYNGR